LLCFSIVSFLIGEAPLKNTIDVDGQTSVVDIRAHLLLKVNQRLVPLGDAVDTLRVQAPYEFEFSIHNTSSLPVTYFLVLGDNSLMADWVSVDARFFYLPGNKVKIDVSPNNISVIGFRLPELDRMKRIRLDPKLLTPGDFEQKEKNGRLLQPFFIGIFLFMIFFNLFYYFISGWKVYLKYAVYIFLSLCFFSFYFGVLQLLFPWIAYASNNLVWILSSLIAPAYVIFISDFGEFKNLDPRANRIFQFAIIFKFIQLPLEAFFWVLGFDFIHSQQYILVIMAVEVPLVLFGFYFLLISKGVLAKVIVVASFILLTCSVIGQLNVFTHIDRVVVIETGTLIENMIFSISLAMKAKELDRSRLRATKELLKKTEENVKMQKRVSADLERQVRERTASLEMRNHENEMLMAEIHHRVKNNLQIISSLINLRMKQSSSETNEALQQLNNRIFSMGLIHEKLYQEESIRFIRLDSYLTEIGNYLVGSFSNDIVQFDVESDPVDIDADQALSCGLICNELMINSLKYAFDDSQTQKNIKLSIKRKESLIEISIYDNGAKQFHASEFKKSFGLRFVDQLVNSKLKGTWTHWQNCGFHVKIQIPFRTKANNSEIP